MKKLVAALALSLLTLAQPATAQSLLRDAETEAMFDEDVQCSSVRVLVTTSDEHGASFERSASHPCT